MERYIKETAEVACVLLVVTFAYDWLSASCFNKTHTYRCFKIIRNSKACKRFLKRFKKRRKRCCRCSIWSVYDPPLQNAEVGNQTSLSLATFGFAWPNNWNGTCMNWFCTELKNSTLPLIEEVVTYMEKKFPSLQLLTSMLVQYFMKLAADNVKKFSHYIKKYTTKITGHYQH